MDSERGQPEQSSAGTDQLKPASVGTGFKTAGQQCLPNGETGRIIAEGCLLVGIGSDLEGNSFPLTERAIGTRTGSVTTTSVASSKAASLQTRRKTKDKKTSSEEKKQFDPGGKGEEPLPWKVGLPVFFSFGGGNPGPGCPLLVSCAFLLVCLVVYFYYQVIMFLRAQENMGKERRKSTKSVTGGQASSCQSTP